jgi:hypothetical protein
VVQAALPVPIHDIKQQRDLTHVVPATGDRARQKDERTDIEGKGRMETKVKERWKAEKE